MRSRQDVSLLKLVEDGSPIFESSAEFATLDLPVA